MATDIHERLEALAHTLPAAIDTDLDAADIVRSGARRRRLRTATVAGLGVGATGALLALVVSLGVVGNPREPRLEVLGAPGVTIPASDFAERVRECAEDAGLDARHLTTEQRGRALQWDGDGDGDTGPATLERVDEIVTTCANQLYVDPADTRFERPGPKDRPDGFADWSAQHPATRSARHSIRDAMIECLTERGVSAVPLGDEMRVVDTGAPDGIPARTAGEARGKVVVACEAAHDPRQPWAVDEAARNYEAQVRTVDELTARVDQLRAQLVTSRADGSSDAATVTLERRLEAAVERLADARDGLDMLEIGLVTDSTAS